MVKMYKKDTSFLLLLWAMFTATAPFYLHLAIPYHPYKFIIAFGLGYMLYALSFRKEVRLGNKVIISILALQIVYSIMASVLQSTFLGVDRLYINLSIQLVAVTIVYIYVYTFFNINKLALSTSYIFISMGVLGGVAFFLGAVGVLKPVSMFPSDNPLYTNFLLTFSNAYYEVGNSYIIRIAGYFDEPGSFAYFLTITLLINKLYDYSKKIELALIFLGVFTLSLAFFISVFLYILFFYIKIRHTKIIVLLILSMIASIFVIEEYKDNNATVKLIHELSIGRLKLAENDDVKLISGDNRSQKFLWSKEAFFKSPYIGHGMSAYGNPRSEYYGKLCCNILDPLATHGLIGTVIFFMLFFYWFYTIFDFKKGTLDYVSLGAFLIVIANLFQRPGFHGGLFGYFVYIFLVEASLWRKKNILNNHVS